MKKLSVVVLGAVLLSSLVAAQNKKTVQEYWKAVANKKDVIASTVKIDLKKDHIAFSGSWEGSGEFAVWRKKNGTDLIGETRTGCGPVCMTSNLRFLEPRGSKFVDVTVKVLPKITATQERQMLAVYNRKTGENYSLQDFNYYLKFPNKGTTITLRSGEFSGEDPVLANYKFNGSGFVFELLK
jgi:hypothetical protein